MLSYLKLEWDARGVMSFLLLEEFKYKMHYLLLELEAFKVFSNADILIQ